MFFFRRKPTSAARAWIENQSVLANPPWYDQACQEALLGRVLEGWPLPPELYAEHGEDLIQRILIAHVLAGGSASADQYGVEAYKHNSRVLESLSELKRVMHPSVDFPESREDAWNRELWGGMRKAVEESLEGVSTGYAVEHGLLPRHVDERIAGDRRPSRDDRLDQQAMRHCRALEKLVDANLEAINRYRAMVLRHG